MALTPAAAELSKELTRVLGNITKRNSRLKQKDVKGANLVTERTDTKIEEIRSMPRSNYGEIKSALAQARRLDKSAGTRAQSFQKAAKRAYNDDLVAQAMDPNKTIRMTKEQLQETLSIQRSRIRKRVWRVKQTIDGDNFMTHRAENLLKEGTEGASINRLRSLVFSNTKALKSKVLTPQGAKEFVQHGVDMFGDVYNDLTDEQRSALWKAMRREMELNSLTSPDAIDIIKAAIESIKKQFDFTRSSSDELLAAIGDSASSVEVQIKRMEIDDRNSQEIIRKGKEKWGSRPSTVPWSSPSWDRDYNF